MPAKTRISDTLKSQACMYGNFENSSPEATYWRLLSYGDPEPILPPPPVVAVIALSLTGGGVGRERGNLIRTCCCCWYSTSPFETTFIYMYSMPAGWYSNSKQLILLIFLKGTLILIHEDTIPTTDSWRAIAKYDYAEEWDRDQIERWIAAC